MTCAPRCSSGGGGTASSRKQIECSHINQIAANAERGAAGAMPHPQLRGESLESQSIYKGEIRERLPATNIETFGN